MPDARQLAVVIYEAHLHSRRLTTQWSELGGTEKEHWRRVAAAALEWIEEQVGDDD